jgi:hypothetical protein
MSEEFAKVAFNILDQNALYNILEKLDPLSVLELCKTTKAFAKLCRQQSTFRRLMQKHYPEHPLQRDLKLQYMALALGKVTVYAADYEIDDNAIIHFNGFKILPTYSNDTLAPLLKIKGLVQDPITVWIAYINVNNNCVAFNTKSDAINFGYDSMLKALDRYVAKRQRVIRDARWLPNPEGGNTSAEIIAHYMRNREVLLERDEFHKFFAQSDTLWLRGVIYIQIFQTTLEAGPISQEILDEFDDDNSYEYKTE